MSEVVDLVRAELDEVRNDGVSATELKRAQNQLRGSILLGLEASDSRMSRLARGMLTMGRPLAVEELLAGVDAVEQEDLVRYRRRIRELMSGAGYHRFSTDSFVSIVVAGIANASSHRLAA